MFVWLVSHQPAALFSRNKPNHQQPVNTFFSEQISTSHQPNRLMIVFSQFGVTPP
jgi:hypothetical protein